MGFDDLLGNEQLKHRLAAMLRQARFPHCVLISGPDGAGKHTLARLLCAALECEDGHTPPCQGCAQCRKVLGGQHPDIITVDDPDRKTIPVELIRSTCADVFIRPNEGRHKIYVFPYADKLTPADQNTLLKILEEPPAYAVFLLLTPNPGLLLPTVRSRCATLHLQPLDAAILLPALRQRCAGHTETEYRDAAACGYLGAAMEMLKPHTAGTEEFLAAFAARDSLALLHILTPMEKWKREQLLPTLQTWEALLTDALRQRCGAPGTATALQAVCAGRTAKEILQAIEHLRRAVQMCGANVGTGAVCGALAVNLSQ